MQDKEYIMIGAPIITREIFRNVLRPLNNYKFKPSGGFWSSEHINNIGYISEWLIYLLKSDSMAKYRNINQSTIFTLKDSAKILTIDSHEKVLALAKKYPSYHHILGYHEKITSKNTIFDFEKLSRDYDGIFININLFNEQTDTIVFDKINVSSLLLFNLNCIKEYQSAPIIFDIYNHHSLPYIKKDTIGNPQKVEEESQEHHELAEITEKLYLYLMNNYYNYPFEDYDEYLTIMTQTTKEVMSIIKKSEDQKVTEIAKFLESKGMHVKKGLIIQNLALNFLSEYLMQDEERIKTLPKTKVKSPKQYSIL